MGETQLRATLLSTRKLKPQTSQLIKLTLPINIKPSNYDITTHPILKDNYFDLSIKPATIEIKPKQRVIQVQIFNMSTQPFIIHSKSTIAMLKRTKDIPSCARVKVMEKGENEDTGIYLKQTADSKLSAEQFATLRALIDKYKDLFVSDPYKLKAVPDFEADIRTTDQE